MWRLARSASPGRLGAFEEELARGEEGGDAALVMAVTVAALDGARTVGVAALDAAARTISAAQFVDDDRLCTLEAVVTQLAPRECIVLKVCNLVPPPPPFSPAPPPCTCGSGVGTARRSGVAGGHLGESPLVGRVP